MRDFIAICELVVTNGNKCKYAIQDIETDEVIVVSEETLREQILANKIHCSNIEIDTMGVSILTIVSISKNNEKLRGYLGKCKLLGIDERKFNFSCNGYVLSTCKSKRNELIVAPVTCIGNECFANNESGRHLRRIVIPDTVQVIGDNEFKGCKELEEVVLGKNIKYIGQEAFFGCEKLTRINLPNSIQYIGAGCFCGCKALTSIDIPRSIKVIEPTTFYLTGLLEAEIPDNIREIGHGAFERCDKLSKIGFGKGVQKIDYNAFIGCNKLDEFVLPESMQVLGSSALYTNTGNTYANIVIKSKEIKLEKCCFQGQNINSIQFPEVIAKVGGGVFKNCVFNTDVHLPRILDRTANQQKNQEGMFQGAGGKRVFMQPDEVLQRLDFSLSSFDEVILPTSIKRIPTAAFTYADIRKLEIPDGVRTIEEKAFYGSNMGELICPASIETIKQGAFMYSTIKLIRTKSESVFKMIKAEIKNEKTTVILE